MVRLGWVQRARATGQHPEGAVVVGQAQPVAAEESAESVVLAGSEQPEQVSPVGVPVFLPQVEAVGRILRGYVLRRFSQHRRRLL